jgi:hypothetical protein
MTGSFGSTTIVSQRSPICGQLLPERRWTAAPEVGSLHLLAIGVEVMAAERETAALAARPSRRPSTSCHDPVSERNRDCSLIDTKLRPPKLTAFSESATCGQALGSPRTLGCRTS